MESRTFAFVGTLVALFLICAGPPSVSGASRFKRQTAGVAVDVNITTPFQQAFNALLNISLSLPPIVQQAILQFAQVGANATGNLTTALQQALSQASAENQQIIQNFLGVLQSATQAGSVILNQAISQVVNASTTAIQTLQKLVTLTQTLATELANTVAQNALTPIASIANSLSAALANGTFSNALSQGISSGALATNATAAQIAQFLQSINGAFSAATQANLGLFNSFHSLAVDVFLLPIQAGLSFLSGLFGIFGQIG